MVAGHCLVGLLLCADGGQLFLAAEAGISQTLFDQLLNEGLIDLTAEALGVGAVSAALTILVDALVEVDAEAVQTVDDGRDTVFLLTLLVGILDTQQENAARLMSAALIDQRCENTADVQEAGGAGGETGDHCAFGQFSLGVDLFTILLCSCLDMRE